ncbi:MULTISPECIES: sugar MFS transporter [Aquirufa]|uniref:Sugar MFS transporter n=2 Tax=Aquirufa TaxID=2676247 RepID=A0ABT4JDK4_9BACT|nr:sugar MFS transporter [Aquirufa ecclesiirivi]MCZ2472010.1 sugar MFS transporter [Aquirufa ecclesiirivi]MCZ2474313.1 sugar MFS transporter [Aquirufa ecclesiirivi]MDF0693717.1 sugar MFS transporter [Aquirufa ecclesiirivi]NHC48395.1 sugar MFS transporter [Aquirufa ecclesiirivi]
MTTTNKPTNTSAALLIIGILFFVFGFVTWVNSVLIAFFKAAFALNNFESLLVTSAFFISYFVMAIPSSWVLAKTGFKNGMSLGLMVMAVGTVLFVPAAQMSNYPMFLLGLFVIGTGLALLQTASNPYVTILGSPDSAAKRISVMGICNKVAGILSQFIFGGLLLSSTTDAKDLSIVVNPYLIMTGVLVGLALLVRFSTLPEVEAEESAESAAEQRSSVWAYPNLVLGLVAFFLYVGVEVMAGDTIINYGVSQGIDMEVAKTFTTYTLYGMLAGYVVGILFIPKILSQQKALNYSAILGVVFSLGTVLLDGYYSVMCLALLGLANALMWPALWPLAISGLGKYTKLGSALIIMMISGGALIPLLYGDIADRIQDTQIAYVIMVPCYLFILFYATIGHKKSSW